jgi:DNA-binding transcriptional regulator YiaG
MPNIAAVLKSEIARVARKEVRSETAALKKAVSTNRSEIAALKGRVQELERQVRGAGSRAPTSSVTAPRQAVPEVRRFSAKGFASQRKRLGLSAAQCGLLLGASPQSIYNWEGGTTRPGAKHMSLIAMLRGMVRKTAVARLEASNT